MRIIHTKPKLFPLNNILKNIDITITKNNGKSKQKLAFNNNKNKLISLILQLIKKNYFIIKIF